VFHALCPQQKSACRGPSFHVNLGVAKAGFERGGGKYGEGIFLGESEDEAQRIGAGSAISFLPSRV
jgi:hypothetical protein